MRPSIHALLVLILVQTASASDPFNTLLASEQAQRSSAEVGNSQYYLLPFRVSGAPQYFIQNPPVDELLHVEVIVHWIGNNSRLEFPEFDLTQQVRLVVEEEKMGAVPEQPILSMSFLTQTGFKLQLEGGRRYRWKIESSGVIPKLVEIAMVNKIRNATASAGSSPQVHKDEVELLKEMTKTLEKAKQVRVQRENKIKQAKIADIWAWMSGVEMVSLLAFLLVQLALFEKFMLPTSVV